MELTDGRNQQVPLFVDDIYIADVSSADFDPYNDGTITTSNQAKYLNKGFLVRPATEGSIKVVTWANYKDNKDVVIDANAVILTGCVTSKWEEVRVVKVFTGSDTDADSVMIGILA